MHAHVGRSHVQRSVSDRNPNYSFGESLLLRGELHQLLPLLRSNSWNRSGAQRGVNDRSSSADEATVSMWCVKTEVTVWNSFLSESLYRFQELYKWQVDWSPGWVENRFLTQFNLCTLQVFLCDIDDDDDDQLSLEGKQSTSNLSWNFLTHIFLRLIYWYINICPSKTFSTMLMVDKSRFEDRIDVTRTAICDVFANRSNIHWKSFTDILL